MFPAACGCDSDRGLVPILRGGGPPTCLQMTRQSFQSLDARIEERRFCKILFAGQTVRPVIPRGRGQSLLKML